MPIVATVLEDSAQVDGQRYIRASYTQGTFHTVQLFQLGAADNAQAFADAKIPGITQQATADERAEALAMAYRGENPDLVSWEFNTTEDIRTFVHRRASNDSNTTDGTMAEELMQYQTGYMDLFTNTEIRNYLVGATTGQVNGWRGWLEGLNTQFRIHVHGVPSPQDDNFDGNSPT